MDFSSPELPPRNQEVKNTEIRKLSRVYQPPKPDLREYYNREISRKGGDRIKDVGSRRITKKDGIASKINFKSLAAALGIAVSSTFLSGNPSLDQPHDYSGRYEAIKELDEAGYTNHITITDTSSNENNSVETSPEQKVRSYIIDNSLDGHYHQDTVKQANEIFDKKVANLTPADKKKIIEIIDQRWNTIAQNRVKLEKTLGIKIKPELDYIIAGIIKTESNNDPKAGNDITDARGLCQIRKQVLVDLQRMLSKDKLQALGWDKSVDELYEQLYDSDFNIAVALTYLNELKRHFGDLGIALMAYNEGPGTIGHDIYVATIKKAQAEIDANKPGASSIDQIEKDYDSYLQSATAVYGIKYELTPFSMYGKDEEKLVYFLRVGTAAIETSRVINSQIAKN